MCLKLYIHYDTHNWHLNGFYNGFYSTHFINKFYWFDYKFNFNYIKYNNSFFHFKGKSSKIYLISA